LRALYPVIVLSVAAVIASGCETTQEKSAKLEGEGAELAQTEKVSIGATNRDLEITDKFMITDEYGTVVVARVKNSGAAGQIDVPIQIDVRNAKGKSVYRNDIEGLEEGLVNIQVVEPRAEAWWVNDQVLATGKPASVEIEIGTSKERYPARLPEIEVSEPKILNDPVSGVFATGKVTNRSSIEQTDLLIYAVATKGGKVVAAGRGLIPKLKADGKAETYNIYFIGDPQGADIEVLANPQNFE
jgi:hypothetical protein